MVTICVHTHVHTQSKEGLYYIIHVFCDGDHMCPHPCTYPVKGVVSRSTNYGVPLTVNEMLFISRVHMLYGICCVLCLF